MGRFNLLSERLNWAIERKLEGDPSLKKITQRALAKVAELSPSAVGYWFADKNGIDAEPARKVGTFLGVDPVWLEKGEGEPLSGYTGEERRTENREGHTPGAYAQINGGPDLQLRQGRYVAIVGTGRGGPDGYLSIDDFPPGQGDGFIYTYSPDPTAYALRVRGDSMRPRIKSGEFIVVETMIEAKPGDDVVVKLADDRAMVKELLWIRDGEVSLGSINDSIPPMTIQLAEIKSIHRVAAIVPRGSALVRHRED
jgi:phage repressor protein C with HTH and peptisase S24 domain